MSLCVTTGSTDDRKLVPALLEGLFGIVYGEKEYVSQQLADLLAGKQIRFVAKPKKNMKKIALSDFDKVILRQSYAESKGCH